MTEVLPVEQIEQAARLGAAIDAINDAVAGVTDPGQALIAAKCRGLMAGYHARWCNEQYKTISAEETVLVDLWNPESGRKSRTFRVVSKKDALCRDERERLVLFDHKSTGEDISDPNSPYWRQLVVEAQPSHYMLVEWLNGHKVDGAVWDVVRKPGISPKNVAKGDVQNTLSTGVYFGRKLSADALAQLKTTGREDLEMYEARLAHDCTAERPQWYFQRRSVPRLNAELYEWAAELWEHSQEIIHARATNRWSKNWKSCMAYNRPCEFLEICSGHDTVESDNWRKKEFVHGELRQIEGDGRELLTQSRIGCFLMCRRKHFYQYELGIERQHEDEAEALFFGNLWHRAQEAWFLAAKEAA
jgi:hypothetical protein